MLRFATIFSLQAKYAQKVPSHALLHLQVPVLNDRSQPDYVSAYPSGKLPSTHPSTLAVCHCDLDNDGASATDASRN
jgi:hypothetical protein